jgi:DNA topoisomerase-1
VVAAIKDTAEMLGNTPAVCRSSYINPAVINSFEKGKIMHGAERGLLKFLKSDAK